jgi:tyrosyl-tRNA synthetase
VIFPYLERKGDKFIIDRPEKFGGEIIYEDCAKLKKDFSDEKLHPADLKLGTSKYLNEILERVRIRFKEKDELLNKAFS